MNPASFFCDGVAQLSAMSAWAVLLCKATLLLAFAWLIHFALAQANPRWRIFLWRGVVVGLVLPALWIFGLPGVKIYVQAPEPVAITAPISVQAVAAGHDSKIIANNFESPVENPAEMAQPVEFSALSLPWQSILLGIWGFGVALFALRLAIGYLRLGKLLKTSHSAPEAVVAEARRIAAALGCRRTVRILVTRHFSVPFMFGIMRPVLVLPQRMCETSYGPQLPGILAHELAHLHSWDLSWNVVMQFISILLWFHPLAWRIGSAHRAACDAVCDAVSASYLGDVQAYCRTLAGVALEATSPIATAGLAMARGCDVRRRLAALKRKVFVAPLKRRSVVGAAIIGLSIVTLVAGLKFALAETPPKAKEDKAATASEQKIPDDGTISLAETIRSVNEQAAKLAETRTLKPLTEDEVLKQIDQLSPNNQLLDEEYQQLKRIAETRRLPKNIILRQFVRYYDDTSVEHGWWVRLIIMRDDRAPSSITIRQESLFRRPYTQKERMFHEETRKSGIPTMGRLVVYFDDDPKFDDVQNFSKQEADRLADAVKKAISDKKTDDLLKAYDWEKVDKETRTSVSKEMEQLTKRRLNSVSVSPRRFGGKLIHWQGAKTIEPNLPVLGYIVLEFADKDGPSSVSLEFGQTKDGARLANYIVTKDDFTHLVGKPASRPFQSRYIQILHSEIGWSELISQIDAPDEFSILRNANLEIWKMRL